VSGKTRTPARECLARYNNVAAAGYPSTWVTLLTDSPDTDTPTVYSEWSGGRVRVHPNSGSGSPYWSSPASLNSFQEEIHNVGSIAWNSVSIPGGTEIVVAAAVFDSETSGNMLSWDTLSEPRTVTDGESFVFATGQFIITED